MSIRVKIFEKEKYNCQICQRQFKSYDLLRRHGYRSHKIISNQFYVDFYLNSIWPLCKCGCGEKVKDPKLFIIDGKDWQQTYLRGHISRIKNNSRHS